MADEQQPETNLTQRVRELEARIEAASVIVRAHHGGDRISETVIRALYGPSSLYGPPPTPVPDPTHPVAQARDAHERADRAALALRDMLAQLSGAIFDVDYLDNKVTTEYNPTSRDDCAACDYFGDPCPYHWGVQSAAQSAGLATAARRVALNAFSDQSLRHAVRRPHGTDEGNGCTMHCTVCGVAELARQILALDDALDDDDARMIRAVADAGCCRPEAPKGTDQT